MTAYSRPRSSERQVSDVVVLQRPTPAALGFDVRLLTFEQSINRPLRRALYIRAFASAFIRAFRDFFPSRVNACENVEGEQVLRNKREGFGVTRRFATFFFFPTPDLPPCCNIFLPNISWDFASLFGNPARSADFYELVANLKARERT